MTTTQFLATATVKYGSQPCTTQYGERYSAVVITDNSGTEIKLWGDASSDVAFLKRGEKVTLVNVAGKWKISTAHPITPAPNQSETIAKEPKQAIASYVTEMANLYGYCLAQAQSIASSDLPPEAVKDIATTLFITTQRKFNL